MKMKLHIGREGLTLVELIIAITVLGIIAGTSIPIVVDLLSSLSYAQNKSSIHQVKREVAARLTKELKQAVESPDSLRPWISADGSVLRFYRSTVAGDSIRYYFASNGREIFLYRSSGNTSGVTVPSYAERSVDFVRGGFTVEGGATGFTSTGRVEVGLVIGRRSGMDPDSIAFDLNVFCRNFK